MAKIAKISTKKGRVWGPLRVLRNLAHGMRPLITRDGWLRSTVRPVRKGIQVAIWGNAPVMNTYVFSVPGGEDLTEGIEMAVLPNPEFHFWRTDDRRTSRNIYAILSNDVVRPSPNDPLIGSMETSLMAEMVVATHNDLIRIYGRHFPKRLNEQVEQIT